MIECCHRATQYILCIFVANVEGQEGQYDLSVHVLSNTVDEPGLSTWFSFLCEKEASQILKHFLSLWRYCLH